MSRLALSCRRLGIQSSKIWTNAQKQGIKQNIAVVAIQSRDSHTLQHHSTSPRLLRPSHVTLAHSAGLSWKSDPDLLPRSLPDKGKLVYIGALTNPMRIVKAFSLSTSVCGMAAQPVIFQSADQMPTWLKVAVGGTMSLFIFLTPLVLHFITKRYVTHMYYDRATNQYSATTLTLFLQEKEHNFTPADIKVPELPTALTTIKANNFPLLLDPNSFTDKEAFIKLMKYDEPIDWQLPNDDDEDEVESKESHKK